MHVAVVHGLRKCTTFLVVVTPYDDVAKWASTPIPTFQPNSPFVPLVLGPEALPQTLTEAMATTNPELASCPWAASTFCPPSSAPSSPSPGPTYSAQGLPGTFRHVENEPLEFLVEYGVFFGFLFLMIMGLTLVRWLSQSDWREAERPLAAGLLLRLHRKANGNAGIRLPLSRFGPVSGEGVGGVGAGTGRAANPTNSTADSSGPRQ